MSFGHYSSTKLLLSPRRTTRKISKTPFKVLDAPELQDDFYLNLLDWSSLNMLSVGLGPAVYLWSACTCQVSISILCGVKNLWFYCIWRNPWRFYPTNFQLYVPTLFLCPSPSPSPILALIFFSLFEQVSRLCDLSENNDTVTSVSWSERVSHS